MDNNNKNLKGIVAVFCFVVLFLMLIGVIPVNPISLGFVIVFMLFVIFHGKVK